MHQDQYLGPHFCRRYYTSSCCEARNRNFLINPDRHRKMAPINLWDIQLGGEPTISDDPRTYLLHLLGVILQPLLRAAILARLQPNYEHCRQYPRVRCLHHHATSLAGRARAEASPRSGSGRRVTVGATAYTIWMRSGKRAVNDHESAALCSTIPLRKMPQLCTKRSLR